MRARIISLATVAAVSASALLGQTQTASAATAQFYVTGYVLLGYTATGTYVHPGTCAVDPRVIPLGTYFTISGIGTCHAEDTGGAIVGYRIDVWVPTVGDAYAITGWHTVTWGVPATQQVLGFHASQNPPPQRPQPPAVAQSRPPVTQVVQPKPSPPPPPPLPAAPPAGASFQPRPQPASFQPSPLPQVGTFSQAARQTAWNLLSDHGALLIQAVRRITRQVPPVKPG